MGTLQVYTYPALNNWMRTWFGNYDKTGKLIDAIDGIVDEVEVVGEDFKVFKCINGEIRVEGLDSITRKHVEEAMAYLVLRNKAKSKMAREVA